MIRKTSIICLEVILGIAVVLGILGAASAWRLSQGPVSIKFLLPYAEDFLHRADSPVQADLEDLILTWAGWERALDLRALRVQLSDSEDGRRLARIREVSVTLSVRALIRGKVAPTSLEVIRPLIRLTRQEDGSFRFGVGEPDSAAEETKGDLLTQLLDELSRPSNTGGSLGYLNRISVIGAALRVQDEKLGITWGARHADITAERAPIGLRASFDMTADFKTSQPEIDGEAYYNRAKKFIDVAAIFRKLNPGKLGQRFEPLAALVPLQTDLSGEINAQVGLDGDIKRTSFELAAGPGSVKIPDLDADPITFRKIDLKGRLNRSPDQIQISSLTAVFDDATVDVTGVVTRVGGIAALNATLRVPELPVNAVQKFWLPGTGGGARDWVVANMRDGTITNASASLVARIGIEGKSSGRVDVDSINGRFSIDDVTVDYLAPMPPITNAAATATFSNTRFDFAVHKGRVGELLIGEGAVNITDIGAAREMLGVTALIRGPVKPALELVAHPRLNLLRSVGLTTEGVEGTHATRLQIDLPLLDALKAEDVRVSATSNIEGLTMADVLKDRGVSGGRVSLTVTNDALTASGDADYANTPTRFTWTEDFSGAQTVKRRLDAELTADAALASVFDLNYPEILEGPVPLKLVYQERRDDTASISAGLNLQGAKLSVPGFDWAKQPGRRGTAQIAASFQNGTIKTIDRFAIDAGVFSATGKVVFAERSGTSDPSLENLRLEQFKLGSTEFAADVKRDKDGEYSIAVKGRGFDASPFVGQDLQGVDTPQLPPFRLTGAFEKFWIGPGAATNNVNMKLHHDGAHWQFIDVVGALPDGGKAIEIRMHPNAEGHEMALYSADAGVFLKAMDITDTIVGGSIELAGIRRGGPEAPWAGTARMQRFRVANAPNMVRLLTIASLTGISNLAAGKGIEFRHVRFPFVFENDTATIRDAQAVGSELGITASGKIDFANDAIDITGTIVPAYTINSLLGKIPAIGTIFSGEKGGGIFAASYKVSGPVEKPVMSVNPLSALAPGFLRNLLDGGEGLNEGKTPSQEESLRESQQNQTAPTQ
ncbi:MAG: AsmA-like C-terminal domain-containing protein [Alphaproteobacteria bacterium]